MSDDPQLSVHIWKWGIKKLPGISVYGQVYQVMDFTIEWQELDLAIIRDLSPQLFVSADFFSWAS